MDVTFWWQVTLPKSNTEFLRYRTWSFRLTWSAGAAAGRWAGTASASARAAHDFVAGLERCGWHHLLYLTAITLGAVNLWRLTKHKLFKIFSTTGTMIFIDRHTIHLHFLNINNRYFYFSQYLLPEFCTSYRSEAPKILCLTQIFQ